MAGFRELRSKSVVLAQTNIDTDQIIPARFLSTTERAGLGRNAFNDWRWQADGSPNPAFPFNQPENQGRSILLAGRNFGSGSSREHAVWALTDFGFRCVISPGFADIFYNNSLKNGLLPVTLPEDVVNMLLDLVEEDPETTIFVDLKSQTVTLPDGQQHSFAIDPFRKICLLEGLDDLGYIGSKEAAIDAYEATTPY